MLGAQSNLRVFLLSGCTVYKEPDIVVADELMAG